MMRAPRRELQLGLQAAAKVLLASMRLQRCVSLHTRTRTRTRVYSTTVSPAACLDLIAARALALLDFTAKFRC
jgi:hypothetical protein